MTKEQEEIRKKDINLGFRGCAICAVCYNGVIKIEEMVMNEKRYAIIKSDFYGLGIDDEASGQELIDLAATDGDRVVFDGQDAICEHDEMHAPDGSLMDEPETESFVIARLK